MTWGGPPGVEQPLAISAAFAAQFVRDAHVFVAEGFTRIGDVASLAKESEESISGSIVDGARRWQRDERAPAWTLNYFITAEDPVEGVLKKGKVRKGKERPRIDIRVESAEIRSRPVFTFEAKRFYSGSRAPQYIGAAGLGMFLDGTKGCGDGAGGMLAYVQQGTLSEVVASLEAALVADRAKYGLSSTGSIWMPVQHDTRIPITLVSRHVRLNALPEMWVHHSFFACCLAASASPQPNPG